MATVFWILNIILLILITAAGFAIAYFLIKKAVKQGILEAYEEIRKKEEPPESR